MKMLPPLRKRFCRSLTLLVLLLTEGLAATKGLMLSMSPQVLPPHSHTTLTRTLLRLRTGRDGQRAAELTCEDFTITEKAPTRAFSWLKVSTDAFTFKNLCEL